MVHALCADGPMTGWVFTGRVTETIDDGKKFVGFPLVERTVVHEDCPNELAKERELAETACAAIVDELMKGNDRVRVHERVTLFWVAVFNKAETPTQFHVAETEAELREFVRGAEIGYAFEGNVAVMDADVDGTKHIVAIPTLRKCLVHDNCQDDRADALQPYVFDMVTQAAVSRTASNFTRLRNCPN